MFIELISVILQLIGLQQFFGITSNIEVSTPLTRLSNLSFLYLTCHDFVSWYWNCYAESDSIVHILWQDKGSPTLWRWTKMNLCASFASTICSDLAMRSGYRMDAKRRTLCMASWPPHAVQKVIVSRMCSNVTWT